MRVLISGASGLVGTELYSQLKAAGHEPLKLVRRQAKASDEISWDCAHRDTGKPLARVVMKAGDMAAMPAYCRHQGFSPKRSMLLVWENGSPKLVYEIQNGEAPQVPVQF